MKIAYRLFIVLLISAFLFSCSEKKAGIEGKLQNGQGQPISGVTVIFKQVQTFKGYEQFETKTLADGSFRIDGVMPVAEYIITPVSSNWKTKVTTKITALAAGQTLVLSSPIVIRFNALKDGTVVDTKTGLQWLILGIPNLNSRNVLNAVKNIKEGGFTDWRLPTQTELSELSGTPSPFAPATLPATEATSAPAVQPESASVQNTCCTWVIEPTAGSIEWKFYVDDGNDLWASSKVPPDNRIVIVRNYIPAANLAAEKKLVPESASPANQSPSAKVTTVQPDNSMTIQFAMNKSIISPEELSKLKAFYAKIKGKKGMIVIEGNSASDGDTADNFKISGDRALSVKAMLHRLGLSKTVNVKIAGLSDTKPIAENTTEAGRILNRRADINFIPE